MNVLRRTDVERIIGAIDTSSRSGLRAKAALLLAYSGLTSGEIVRVRREHVRDLDRHGHVHIPTRSRGQDIPLRDEVCTALRAWLAKAPRSEWLLCAYAQGSEGNPISDGDIRAACDRAVRDAGLDPAEISPTVLRESYAWLLARQGASREDVAEIMGWAQLRYADRIMREPAPDLADRVRGMSAQPPLPAHASEAETRELREQLDALRDEVKKLDTRGDVTQLEERVGELGASIADVRRILDARHERLQTVEQLVGDLLDDLGRGELQMAIAERQREERRTATSPPGPLSRTSRSEVMEEGEDGNGNGGGAQVSALQNGDGEGDHRGS